MSLSRCNPPGGVLVLEILHVQPIDELDKLLEGLVLGLEGEGLREAVVQDGEADQIASAVVTAGLHRTNQVRR